MPDYDQPIKSAPDHGSHQWARAFHFEQCRAAREPRPDSKWPPTVTGFHGRCELRKGHVGDHALERGMDCPHWSTDWT